MKKTVNNKNSISRVLLGLSILITMNVNAQNVRPKVGVLNIDARMDKTDPIQLGNIVRLELAKLDSFDVLDRYDVLDVVKKNNLQVDNCYGTQCLCEIGKAIGSQYMLSGSAEVVSNSIIINLKLIDVSKQAGIKSTVRTFNNLPGEIANMVSITVSEMFGRKFDAQINERLTKKFDFENTMNEPDVKQISLQGPRMGVTLLTGTDANTLQRAQNDGGFELRPLMFQIGYQFEKQYLNGGNYQALFEFIPMVTGLDQSKFLPSVTIFNGLRDNRHGWEFAIGATFALTTMADVWTSSDGKHYLNSTDSAGVQRSYLNSTEYRTSPGKKAPDFKESFDNDGQTKIMTAIVLAVGKSFRTGTLNVPVNFWVMPQKDAIRFGLSVGFNSSK